MIALILTIYPYIFKNSFSNNTSSFKENTFKIYVPFDKSRTKFEKDFEMDRDRAWRVNLPDFTRGFSVVSYRIEKTQAVLSKHPR